MRIDAIKSNPIVERLLTAFGQTECPGKDAFPDSFDIEAHDEASCEGEYGRRSMFKTSSTGQRRWTGSRRMRSPIICRRTSRSPSLFRKWLGQCQTQLSGSLHHPIVITPKGPCASTRWLSN